MHRSKNILDKSLLVLGFNLFNSVTSTIPLFFTFVRRLAFQGCEAILICMFVYCMTMDPDTVVGDKFFMFDLFVVFTSMQIQVFVMTTHREEIISILDEIEKMARTRENPYVDKLSSPLFRRCEEVLVVVSRVQFGLSFGNTVAVNLAPFLSKTNHIYPMEFEIIRNSTTLNNHVNDFIQAFGGSFVCMYFGLFSLIFINCTIGILYELRLIAELCNTVGNKEESDLVRAKPGNEMMEEVPMMETSQLLPTIIQLHNNALK